MQVLLPGGTPILSRAAWGRRRGTRTACL